jgi:hypothetical protein
MIGAVFAERFENASEGFHPEDILPGVMRVL